MTAVLNYVKGLHMTDGVDLFRVIPEDKFGYEIFNLSQSDPGKHHVNAK